jgi:hypothetical protein
VVSNWKVKRQINEFVDLLAISPVDQFYPTAVPKYTEGIELEQAFDYLLDLCKDEILQLLWEVKCPGSDDASFCLRKLDVTSDYDEVFTRNYLCDICGKESCADKSHVFPVFKIADDYRVEMRAEYKKKTKSPSRLRLKMR